MQKTSVLKTKYLTFLILVGLYVPTGAFAAFVPGVPVEDSKVFDSLEQIGGSVIRFKDAFGAYVSDFNNTIYSDENRSLRTLLSLNPEVGVTAELYLPGRPDGTNPNGYPGGGKTPDDEDLKLLKACDTRDITNPTAARASDGGAWEELQKSEKLESTELDYSSVKVNDSTSLTCLLQEIVEQNKLQLNLQIHSLVRDYINDALSAGLAQRTAGVIAKANIDWVKRGNVRTQYDENGIPISQESYSLAGANSEDYKRAFADARVKTIQQGILNNEGQGTSFNVCNTFKYSVARQLLTDARKKNNDPLDMMATEVGCQLTNKENPSAGLFAKETDINEYYADATKGNKSPLDMYMALLENDQNTEVGLSRKLRSAQGSQLTNISDELDADFQASGGYISGRECDPNDPNCDLRNTKRTTPGALIGDITSAAARQQSEAISNAKTSEELAATAKDNYSSTNILSQGLDGYDTNGLVPNQNVSKYVADFLNGIQNGYFDIQRGTTDWASGAMLQIYDVTMADGNAFTGSESTQAIPKDAKISI